MKKLSFYILFLILHSSVLEAQVKIGEKPDSINPASILEMESTQKGLLIPRMTTVQRDAISVPPNGLQIYNITKNTLEIFANDKWESVSYTAPESNLVFVYSLADLPAPNGSEILLDATKVYIFSGTINISPYYRNLNGAGLKGTDPTKDGIMSSVSGAILRSTDVTVYIENLSLLPASGNTKIFDLSDATGTQFCVLNTGTAIVEIGIPSLGVGQISGFHAITISDNYWNCNDGVKITGNVGMFTATYNFVMGITTGSAFEFMSGLTINDIDFSNNYFVYNGQTGIKVASGASIDQGRMSTNLFRGVSAPISGFDSYTPGWEMLMNHPIPNSRSYGLIYMVENTTATSLTLNNTYVKISGATVSTTLQKFTSPTSNRLTYIGKRDITAKIFLVAIGKATSNSADFTIALAKNGNVISAPRQATGTLVNNQGFSLSFELEVEMSTNDYIEVYIKTTTSNSTVTLSDLQLRVVD